MTRPRSRKPSPAGDVGARSAPRGGERGAVNCGPRLQCSKLRPPALLNYLGGAQQNGSGYGKAECLGGLEVHGHLELGRKLHRQIARLFAAQNAIDIGGGAVKDVYHVDSVGEQSAVSGTYGIRIDCRYVVLGRRQYDRRAMRDHPCIRDGNKATSGLAPKVDDGRFDLYVAMNGRNDWRDLELPGRRLKRGHKSRCGGRVGIEHDGGPPEPRSDLREQLKPLASQRGFQAAEAGGVPARAVEPRDNAAGN